MKNNIFKALSIFTLVFVVMSTTGAASALWWHSEVRQVSPALSGVGELKFLASEELKRKGFSDVRNNDLDVFGVKEGVVVSIAHFRIADRQYWEVVMSSGDTVEKTKRINGEVVEILRNMRFL